MNFSGDMNFSGHVADVLAIHDLHARYAMCLNHRDWSNFEKLLTEDFHWSCSEPISNEMLSRAAMMELMHKSQSYKYGWIFQMPHGFVIDAINGADAKGRHTLQIRSDKYKSIGIYYDRMCKGQDGAWRFARRDYQVTYYEKVAAPEGTAFRTLPDPGKPEWYF